MGAAHGVGKRNAKAREGKDKEGLGIERTWGAGVLRPYEGSEFDEELADVGALEEHVDGFGGLL